MNTNSSKQVIGVFPNQETLERALLGLQRINFPMQKISVVPKKTGDKANPRPITRAEGAKAGAILAGMGTGLTTLTIGLGILFVPGVGPALALDSLLTAFLGSGIVSAAGGLYGALLGCLDPEKQVRSYREQFKRDFKQGDCLVIIEATEPQILAVKSILRRCHVQLWQVYDLPKTLKS